jgi:hypothetical protein
VRAAIGDGLEMHQISSSMLLQATKTIQVILYELNAPPAGRPLQNGISN